MMEAGKTEPDCSTHARGSRVAAPGEGKALGGHTDEAYGVLGAAETLFGASGKLL